MMKGIGKIWAKRVLAGTQKAEDCPRDIRQDMLDSLIITPIYKDAVIDCTISDIVNKVYESRQAAREAVGLLYSDKTIGQEDVSILTAKIDEIYGVV